MNHEKLKKVLEVISKWESLEKDQFIHDVFDQHLSEHALDEIIKQQGISVTDTARERFNLYKLDFHFGGIAYVGEVKCTGVCVTPQPILSEVLVQIVQDVRFRWKHPLFDSGMIFLACKEQWIAVHSDNHLYHNETANEFIVSKNIIAVFDIDWDESDSYLIVKE